MRGIDDAPDSARLIINRDGAIMPRYENTYTYRA